MTNRYIVDMKIRRGRPSRWMAWDGLKGEAAMSYPFTDAGGDQARALVDALNACDYLKRRVEVYAEYRSIGWSDDQLPDLLGPLPLPC